MLIECPECKHQVSDQAESCPQCGNPMKQPTPTIPTDKSNVRNMPIFLMLSVIAFILSLNTPKFLLFFPLMSTLGCAIISIFRKEKGRAGAVLVLILTGGIFILSEIGDGIPQTDVASQHLDSAEITQWNWNKDPNFGTRGTIKWNVQVRNKSSENLSHVKVEFATYDKAGKLVSSTCAYVSAIPPGQTRTEESYADLYGTEESATVQIADVTLSR